MKTIKILGGGISGLTAAINLKYAGRAVEVHERKRFCGKHTHDFQFLENWTFKEDALAILHKINIERNFYLKPWYSLEFISPSLNRCLKKSSQPLMYLVKRGPIEGSIDEALQKQAQAADIPIIFRSKLTANEADIIAIGRKSPNFLVTGITFPCDRQDRALVLFDDRHSLKMYSYFTVHDGVGQISVINPVARKDHKRRLDLCIKRFEVILNYKIPTISHRFAALGNLYYLKNARIQGRYYVGEAAGFQDCLAGFGILYAFKSGYHAFCSIYRKDDYNHRWQADMLKPMRVSCRNRRLFEGLSNDGYEKLVKILSSTNPLILKLIGGEDLRAILNKLYNRSLSRLLRPMIFWRKLLPLYRFLLSSMERLFFR